MVHRGAREARRECGSGRGSRVGVLAGVLGGGGLGGVIHASWVLGGAGLLSFELVVPVLLRAQHRVDGVPRVLLHQQPA
eukprot:1398659-Rhodomonas_salina.1